VKELQEDGAPVLMGNSGQLTEAGYQIIIVKSKLNWRMVNAQRIFYAARLDDEQTYPTFG
jgi:hypothetical protein